MDNLHSLRVSSLSLNNLLCDAWLWRSCCVVVGVAQIQNNNISVIEVFCAFSTWHLEALHYRRLLIKENINRGHQQAWPILLVAMLYVNEMKNDFIIKGDQTYHILQMFCIICSMYLHLGITCVPCFSWKTLMTACGVKFI